MKKALVVFISILSFFSICLCSSLRDKQEKIESYINTTDSLSSKIELLYGNMKLHYAYNESFLRDFNVISMDGDTIQFSSLLNEKNILVYKFSLTNCISCINHELSVIHHDHNILDRCNAFIIVDSCSFRDLDVFRKYYPMGNISFYRMACTDNDLNKILKEESIPFVFFTNKTMQVKDLFIPMKEIPSFTEEYHKRMYYKYSFI